MIVTPHSLAQSQNNLYGRSFGQAIDRCSQVTAGGGTAQSGKGTAESPNECTSIFASPSDVP
jgi:hypothetical protein